MASLDFWIEEDGGAWGNTINWHREGVPFDLQRFHYDQRYANLVNQHVKNALEYLAKEISDIGRITPWPDEIDWPPCE